MQLLQVQFKPIPLREVASFILITLDRTWGAGYNHPPFGIEGAQTGIIIVR